MTRSSYLFSLCIERKTVLGLSTNYICSDATTRDYGMQGAAPRSLAERETRFIKLDLLKECFLRHMNPPETQLSRRFTISRNSSPFENEPTTATPTLVGCVGSAHVPFPWAILRRKLGSIKLRVLCAARRV